MVSIDRQDVITPDERRVKEIVNTKHESSAVVEMRTGNSNKKTKKKLTGRPSRSSEERDSGTIYVSLLDVDITVWERKRMSGSPMYGARIVYVCA